MKRLLSVLLVLTILSVFPLTAAAAGEPPLPRALEEWMAAFQAEYLQSDPTAPKATVPVPSWPVYTGGDWTIQYPPGWTVLTGDPYSFLACDSRQLSCYDYVQVQSFPQALLHDQIGAYAFSRVAGGSSFSVAGTFAKNVFPQLMLPAPSGIAQVYFVRWQHPEAGNMFTLMQVVILSCYNSFAGGSTSASWSSFTAPEDEFPAMWQSVFSPMFLSATYTIPKEGGTTSDRDGDGYSDEMDAYPDDPFLH
jgi:hypothetical protein